MSVVEEFSGIDINMLQLRKKNLFVLFSFLTCICVQSELAIEICCRQ